VTATAGLVMNPPNLAYRFGLNALYLDLTMNKPTKTQQAIELMALGHTAYAACKIIGISQSCVTRRLKRVRNGCGKAKA
jgi:hypothetical protein